MNFGDVVYVDLGTPIGSEAGFIRPVIILTADAFMRFRPTTVFVVPLTTTPRTFPSHIPLEPDHLNGLLEPSCALVEQLRSIAVERCGKTLGYVGPIATHQILDVLAMMTGMP
jgi:mRNA interferase MazF